MIGTVIVSNVLQFCSTLGYDLRIKDQVLAHNLCFKVSVLS